MTHGAIPLLLKYSGVEIDVKISDVDETILGVVDELLAHISSVNPDSVVFNFECCAACCDNSVGIDAKYFHKFIRFMIDAKHMIMCSDFSVKGLIGTWDADVLGMIVLFFYISHSKNNRPFLGSNISWVKIGSKT